MLLGYDAAQIQILGEYEEARRVSFEEGRREQRRRSVRLAMARLDACRDRHARCAACFSNEGLQTIGVAVRQPINPNSVAGAALCRQGSELRRLGRELENELHCR